MNVLLNLYSGKKAKGEMQWVWNGENINGVTKNYTLIFCATPLKKFFIDAHKIKNKLLKNKNKTTVQEN